MSNSFGGAAALRSALLVTAATYISYAVGLVVSMVAARQLGPRDYGHYAYLVWLSGSLSMLFCNGLTLSAIRFVAESLGRKDLAEAKGVHHLMETWFAASLVAVTAAFAAAAPLLEPAGWERSGWLFALAALIAAAAKSDYTLGASVSKGYGRFEIDANTINLMSLAALLGVLGLAYFGARIDAYIAYFVILSIGHAITTRLLMRRIGIRAARSPIEDGLRGRILNHWFWSAAMFLVFAFSNKSVENVFLNSFVGPEAVGWFAIAAAMTRGGVDLLSSGLTTVLLPMMSHAMGSNDVVRANRILIDAIRYYLFLGVALAGVGVLWAAPVISLLYGSQYAPAIIGLQVMMVVGALTMPQSATASMLMTTDRQSIRVGLAVIALLLTIGAAFVLVPRYGYEGALGAHALARFVIFAASLAMIPRIFQIPLPYAEFLRSMGCAVVGAVLAASVLLVSTSLTAQFLAGAVYALGCIASSLPLGVWTANDVRVIAEIAGRIPRLRPALQWLERHAREA